MLAMQHDHEVVSDLPESFNWCDRRCERCPLSDECVISVEDTELRARHVRAGVDPDAPEVVGPDVLEQLERGLELAIQAARQDGLDPDELLAQPAPTPPEVAMRRRELAMKLVEAIHHGCVGSTGAAARCAIESSIVLAMKVYAVYDAEPADVASNMYLAANLIVLVRLEAELRSALARINLDRSHREQIERLRAGLTLTLAPLWAAIPSDVVAEIDCLIAAHCAPSPFCVRGWSRDDRNVK